jgi:hypothetical protein
LDNAHLGSVPEGRGHKQNTWSRVVHGRYRSPSGTMTSGKEDRKGEERRALRYMYDASCGTCTVGLTLMGHDNLNLTSCRADRSIPKSKPVTRSTGGIGDLRVVEQEILGATKTIEAATATLPTQQRGVPSSHGSSSAVTVLRVGSRGPWTCKCNDSIL